MRIFRTILSTLITIHLLSGQNAAFSSSEMDFIDAYNLLLEGEAVQAVMILDKEVFEKKNYDAVPYYRLAVCAAPKDKAPSIKTVKKATKLAKKAGNDWGASYNLKSFKRVKELIIDKADNGNAVAKTLIATAYETGQGLKRNKDLAAHYMTLAADQGLTCTIYSLGIYYEKGVGVDKDLDKAVSLLELALANNPQGYKQKHLNKLKSKHIKSEDH